MRLYLEITKEKQELPLFDTLLSVGKNFVVDSEPGVDLPDSNLGEEVMDDYASLRLSLKSHPLSLLRNVFPKVFTNRFLPSMTLMMGNA